MLLRDLFRPVLTPIMRGIFDPSQSIAAAWSPARLFAQLFTEGTPGFCGGMSVTEAFQNGWLFQDSAGTTPAALEMPVGLVLGQVGGINAYQTTSTKRPTLKSDSGILYLEFDGTDDCFVTPSIDMTSTDKVAVFAGVEIAAGTALWSGIASNGNVNFVNGAFEVFAKPVSINTVVSYIRVNGAALSASGATDAWPSSSVLTTTASNPGQLVQRVNGTVTNTTTVADAQQFADTPLAIGVSAAPSYFSGKLYTLPIIVGRAVEPALIAEVEAAINASMGGIY